MFIQIQNKRIKIASIGGFSRDGFSSVTKKWYITLTVSGREKKFTFNTERELDDVIAYLDKVLKVQVI